MSKKWIAIGTVIIAIIVIAVALSLHNALSASAGGAGGVTVTVEAQGFGGTITARVTLQGEKITGLEIDGPNETPGIGGAAITSLTESILAAGTVEGIDAVSGATITSNGVLTAVRNAISEAASAPAASS